MDRNSIAALRSLSCGTLSKLLRDACEQYNITDIKTDRYDVLEPFHFHILAEADQRWCDQNMPEHWATMLNAVIPDVMRKYYGARIQA